MTATLRERLGCWLHERWRAELVLRTPALARACGLAWQDLHNRSERLHPDPRTPGRVCAWTDSSKLTVVRTFPDVGVRLLKHVLTEWPVRFAPDDAPIATGDPDVSILIPIAGTARMAQFRLALAAARAQVDVAVETVVVEQWPEATLRGNLPAGVRYLHQPVPVDAEFNKSRALNAAARIASGRYLLILDADLLLPERFASECALALENVDSVRPARWIFYLDRSSSDLLSIAWDATSLVDVDSVVANTPMPIALRRSTYWEVGGHDEAYEGWGGEDTEFLDRLRTCTVGEGGWMPILHVWHPPAAKKADGDRNRRLHDAKMALSTAARIENLAAAVGHHEKESRSTHTGNGNPI